jgi:hypothetical protein
MGEDQHATPEGERPKAKEVVNLNADDLDVQELDEKLLEKAAGGDDGCWTFDCANFDCGTFNKDELT